MITNACIMVNGIKYPCRRHYSAFKVAMLENSISKIRREMQGFLDENGKFYSREEARIHAIECGQIPESFKSTLCSEDLWDV